MTLSPEDRAAFLTLLPGLAPGADAGPVVQFYRDHAQACLAELGAVPGFDHVRAGVLRLLPAVMPDGDERALRHAQARDALAAFEPASLTRAEALRRHPAWVGICLLELGAQAGDDSDAVIARAEALAAAGFASVSPDQPRGTGEVLWAMAEAADEPGWTDHVHGLLERAARSPFSDPENLGRVRLVQVLHLLREEAPDASQAVDALLAMPSLDDRTHIHALWIGAMLDQQASQLVRAVDRLELALELIDAEDEPEVAERITSALQALGVGRADPAEA